MIKLKNCLKSHNQTINTTKGNLLVLNPKFKLFLIQPYVNGVETAETANTIIYF